MINDGGVSRTPRTWTEGSEPPPSDVTELRDAKGNRMLRLRGDRWRFAPFTLNTKPWAAKRDYPKWHKLDDHYWMAWPLVEVLPDAPEPQQRCTQCGGSNTTYQKFSGGQEYYCRDCDEVSPYPREVEGVTVEIAPNPHGEQVRCVCFTVPEERWTRHYDATEPGSMVEPNPDCPVHFPKAPQDDKVGTVRRLGNSWFAKLVEPRSEPWHVVCSNGQQNVSGWQSDEDMQDCPVVGYLPIVECYTPPEVEAARELYRGVARVHDALRAQINAVLDHPVMPSSEKVGAISVILDAETLSAPALSGVELRSVEERDDAFEEQP